MKTLYQLGLFLVLVMLMNSCSGDKNSLTKDTVLENLSEKETLNPIVFKTTLPNVYINSVNDLSNGKSYYSKLYNDGYLTTKLRTDIPNPTASHRPYKVVTTQTAEPYILETKPDGSLVLKTLEFKAVDVKEIRIISDLKAEVDVEFKKTKTPFYDPNGKDVAGSGKEYPNDTYIKTLDFRKSASTNEWKCPIKIVFLKTKYNYVIFFL